MSDRSVPVYQQQRRGLGGQVVEQMIQNVQTIDRDVWQMMDERDSRLIEQELLHGAASSKYVYSFKMAGANEPVSGISVVGARELAAAYGGIRHTLVASITKTGPLFEMKSYPHNGVPIGLYVQHIKELADEPDFYEVLAEIEDMKTGNRVQVEKREYRMEKRSRASLQRNPNLDEWFERPHYQQIAGSKAYRNGVLAIIPQHTIIPWKEKMLRAGNAEVISISEIDEKRAGVLRYAASKAIAVDRDAVEELTFDQISGLSEATRAGQAAFVASGEALGIVPRVRIAEEPSRPVRAATPPREVPRPPAPQAQRQPEPPEPPPPPPDEDIEREVAAVEDRLAPIEPETASLNHLVPPDVDDGIYPLDEDGAPAIDETGDPLRFDTHEAFASWYRDYVQSSPHPELVKKNNSLLVRDAMNDAGASAILEPPPEQPRQRAAVSPLFVPVPEERMPNGSLNWSQYGMTTRRKLLECWSGDMLVDFRAINQPTYGSTPAVVKRVDTLIADRLSALENPTDREMRDARELIGRIVDAPTLDALTALLADPAHKMFMTLMRQNRHDDIYLMIEAAEKAAVARLKQPSLLR